MEIIEQIKEAEKLFDGESSESFAIASGEKNIIVSAPHSVEQLRDGKIKYSERQSGALAVILGKNVGCHAIYKTRNAGDDANFDETSTYRNTLAEYITANKIKALIDLHQMASHREQMICIGTGFEKNLCGREDFAQAAVKAFEAQGIDNVFIDTPFAASYPFTVSSDMAYRCEIPCLQIEINSALLYEKSEKYCTEKVYLALKELLEWAYENI